MNFFHRGIKTQCTCAYVRTVFSWVLKHIIDFECFTLKEKNYNLVPDFINKYESNIYNMGSWIHIFTTTLNVRLTFSVPLVKVMFMISLCRIKCLPPSKCTHILHLDLEVPPSIKVAKQMPPACPYLDINLCWYPFTGIKTLRPQILWKDGSFSMESNVVKSNQTTTDIY